MRYAHNRPKGMVLLGVILQKSEGVYGPLLRAVQVL